MKRLLPILLTVSSLLILLGCSRTPDMVLPAERMARLVADLELADALATDQRLGALATDSSRLELRRSVLARHGINEAVLDSSMRWYGANLPKFLEVLDRADSLLADSMRLVDRLAADYAAAAAGDSADLWPREPSALFARTQPTDFYAFEIPADSTWKRGDVFALEFNFDNASTPLRATMVVDYLNRGATSDAISQRYYPGDTRHFKVIIQTDSNISAKRLYGYFHLSPAEGERAFLDSIRLVRTRLVSDKYNEHRRLQRRILRHDL